MKLTLLVLLNLILINQNIVGEAINTSSVDSLLVEVKDQNGLELARSLIEVIEYYHNVDVDSATLYSKQLLQLSDSLNFLDGIYAATTGLINADFVRGDYVKGIERAIPFSNLDEGNKSYHIANLYLATGNCYGSLGLYKTGVEYYLKARGIFSELNSVEKLTTISNNLGAYYIRMNDYESALEVFDNMDKPDDEDPLKVTMRVNYGFIYLGLDKLKEAEEYFLSVLDFGDKDIEIRAKAISNYKLGNLYTEIEQYQKALFYFDESIKLYTKLDNEAQTINPLNGIAQVHFLLNDHEKAKKVALRAEALGEKNQTLLELNQVVTLLSQIYAREKDYKNAYEYSEKSFVINDSLNVSQRNQEIQVMEAEYEFSRREEMLRNEQTARLRTQRLITTGAGSFFMVSLFFIFIVYRSKKSKEKANIRLEKLNHDLEETIKIKNRLFSIIAHDLRKPLSSLYGLVTLLEMKAADKMEMEKLIPNLVSQFKHTSTLLNNLLNWAKSQMHGYKVVPIQFDILDLLHSNRVLLLQRYDEKGISLSIPEHTEATVYADRNMIDLVILNLFSNALKYSDNGDSVIISTTLNKNFLTVSVKDTGIGIPKSKLDLLFTNSFYSTSGTRNEPGTGLGLMLCKEFIERNNGNIWVESKFGEGTTFFFSLPTIEGAN
ncbi:MAG: tetratricopeptide repeat-containing sensor histidine kinase [Balneola sp.]